MSETLQTLTTGKCGSCGRVILTNQKDLKLQDGGVVNLSSCKHRMTILLELLSSQPRPRLTSAWPTVMGSSQMHFIVFPTSLAPPKRLWVT
jgi:hypothetical protein